MLRNILLIGLMASIFGLAGCNTMAGAGKDIEKAGDKIENSAEKNKKY